MSFHLRLLSAACCAGMSLPTLLLGGCSDAGTVNTMPSATTMAKGNWQITAAATAAARLPALSGEFTTQAGTVTGVVHTQTASACVGPTSSFELAGTADDKNLVTLTGPLAGGTFSLVGTVAPDGRSLGNASYNVIGGDCALAQRVQATAQAFTPITGHYAGNFADADGQVAQVTAAFTQSPSSDPNGNFTLSGTATVSNNPCFPAAVPLSNTQVTGGTFTFTYAANGNSVTANGTFSADASTLAITSWTSSGTCGPDTGVASTMTRQGS